VGMAALRGAATSNAAASRSASFRIILTRAFLTPTSRPQKFYGGNSFERNMAGMAKCRRAPPRTHARPPFSFTDPVMTLATVIPRSVAHVVAQMAGVKPVSPTGVSLATFRDRMHVA
jgi:hypothetical protein